MALNGRTPLSIRLERKSLGDLYSCFGFHRERFEHEPRRLAQYGYRGIIIEATLGEIGNGYQRSRAACAALRERP